jgi:RNA polymerase sigma-70 factor (ECF subfamily)
MSEEELRRSAVEQAYRVHADDVYRVAFAILRDPDAASDATHEAFARAFERWEQYDAARPLRPWLHRIAANAALDALRRRRVRAIAVRLDDDGRPLPGEPAADDPARAVEWRGLIDEGLAALKPDARAAVVLRHYYGYDYQGIATILGTSPGNVGSMLSRAHAALRARLAAVPADADAGTVRRAVP